MKNEYPTWWKVLVAAVIIGCVIYILLWLTIGLVCSAVESIVPEECRTEECKLPNRSDSSVVWWESLPFQRIYPTLATLSSNHLEERIPACEGNGDPKSCNMEFGCAGGMGLWQIIPNTWNETIDRMSKAGAYFPERCRQKVYLPVSKDRIEAVFDPVCNDLVGKWLLKTDGTRHWGTAETWWGSYWCWSR